MRKITILVILTWAVISCIFDTTVRNISNLNFEFYLSFMIAASMELPADLASIWGINWLGRRWSASLSLIGCGLTMLPCAFIAGLNNLHLHHIIMAFALLMTTAPHGIISREKFVFRQQNFYF